MKIIFFIPCPGKKARSALTQILMMLLLCGWLTHPNSAAGESDGNVPVSVTNLAQLCNLLDMDKRLTLSMLLDADVWWSSTSEGRVILKDGSSVVQLELDLPHETPEAGSRIS